MEPQLGDVSDDGYWVLTESGWQATEQQNQALEQGAEPHYEGNEETNTATPPMVTLGATDGNMYGYTEFVSYDSSTVSEGDKQLMMLIGGLIISFGILDFISFWLFDFDITGVWWSALLCGIIGGVIFKIELTSFNLESVYSSTKTQSIFAGISGFVVMMVFLVIVLSMPDGELVGKWTNDVDTLILDEDGKATESSGSFSEWRADSNTIMFTDASDPDYEFWFEYEISNNVLFLAPLDENDNIMGENCVAYVKDGHNFDSSLDGATIPKWCTG
tara:strand:- start:68 stop:889 length:822 start_codon:yes stop_codon:yes gene_type:complete